MPTDGRDDQSAEQEREFVSDALAGLKEDATQEQLDVTLKRLRELRDRIDRQQLEPGDWALLSSLLRQEVR